MDKFTPDSQLDDNQRHAKFLEKIGSTIFSLLFLILFWYYAKSVEVDSLCYASKTSDVLVVPTASGAVEVNSNFTTLLNLYAWSTILDVTRELLAAFFYKCNLAILGLPICILGLNIFVQFAAMIVNHVYRLNHVGKVCAGDYLSKEDKALESYQDSYLLQRGKFLWILLIIYWVIIGLACLCLCCFCVAAAAAK
eukprot:CAMPEP_0170542904 /NCGR_PEP_ID=MMETSP0211-20121228/2192_1 /TAXON_ID=311385 /ORGANISM="Pseudokeronopsis sp., Strain OXSARD2" /LENGTH=194 /DNA_ID=CAMNT_0010846125 /DNA_START=9 /DNA_END=593 /DNA_ORIENTATION=-